MIGILTPLTAIISMASLIFLTYSIRRNRQLKHQQQIIVSKLRGQRFWRINVASPEFIANKFRLYPFEALGVLIDDEQAMRVQGFWHKTGKLTEYIFPKNELQVQWLGNQSMRSGNMYWAQIDCKRGSLQISADTGIQTVNSREALEDIFRGAFPNIRLTEQQTNDFALEKNPRTRIAMGMLFVLLTFALVDTFFISNYELIEHQIVNVLIQPATFFGLGLFYAVSLFSLYLFLKNGAVPARESWVISGFLTMMFLLASAPLAKRIDQYLAGNESQDYAYRVVDGYRLEPIETNKGLPNLRFPKSREYWEQFDQNTAYKVPLLHGPIGLWQLDHDKFDKPMSDFYEAYENQKQSLSEKAKPLKNIENK